MRHIGNLFRKKLQLKDVCWCPFRSYVKGKHSIGREFQCLAVRGKKFCEAAWCINWSYCVWSCFLLIFFCDPATLQDQWELLLKNIKMFVPSFRCSAAALITWDLPNCSLHRSYFVFHVNEVQKAARTEFLCERVIMCLAHFGSENSSLSKIWILSGESDGMEIRITNCKYCKHNPEK